MSNGQSSSAGYERAITDALSCVAAAVLLLMMLLTCTDVIGRYFFNQPVPGGFEITEMLLAALIFSGLPLVTLRNEHVTIDVLDSVTPEWVYRIQHVTACLIAVLSTGYLAWRLWLRALNMDAAGETTAQLKFKLAYLTYGMSILMAFTAVALLVLMMRRPQRQLPGEGVGP